MELILAILAIMLLAILGLEIISFVVFGRGRVITSAKYDFYISSLHYYKLNPYGKDLLFSMNKPFISGAPSIFFPYYIHGRGVVLRNSRLHRAIKERYKQLKYGTDKN